MIIKRKPVLYMACAMMTTLTLCLGSFVRQNIADAKETPVQRMQISPTKENITLKPGEHYSSKYHVQNTGDEPFDFKVFIAPYSVHGETYEQDYDVPGTYTKIVDWIHLGQTEGTAQPGTSIEIPFTIDVPTDAPAGGQYATFITKVTRTDEGNQAVGVEQDYRLAYIIYAEVAGNTRREADILDNHIDTVYLNPPITASSLIENKGNTHGEAKDVLTVSSIFSDKDIIYSNEDKPTTYTIFPDTRRRSFIKWDDTPMIGVFKVKHSVTLFNQESITEAVVLVCPLWIMILVLVLIVGVIIWIVMRVRSRKKSKKP